jgi:predicted O-linked N-acetylglucosamine transferase (SPINDLY family)
MYCDLGDEGSLYRHAIFRLARVQAGTWGCPFTSGLPMLDEYISSEFMEPSDADSHYTERLVRLPHIGLTLDAPRANGLEWGRDHFGLPSGFLATFPQYTIKWLPQWDALLAQVAQATGNPIVFFDLASPYETEVFKRRLERLRIPAIWFPRMTPMEFRRLLSLCDVALDAPDWSGGLTSIQSLQVGAPFVNLAGPDLRRRLASAMCRQAGVSGLVARDIEDYVPLATSPDRLQAAMAHLQAEALFEDRVPLDALEDHILSTVASG